MLHRTDNETARRAAHRYAPVAEQEFRGGRNRISAHFDEREKWRRLSGMTRKIEPHLDSDERRAHIERLADWITERVRSEIAKRKPGIGNGLTQSMCATGGLSTSAGVRDAFDEHHVLSAGASRDEEQLHRDHTAGQVGDATARSTAPQKGGPTRAPEQAGETPAPRTAGPAEGRVAPATRSSDLSASIANDACVVPESFARESSSPLSPCGRGAGGEGSDQEFTIAGGGSGVPEFPALAETQNPELATRNGARISCTTDWLPKLPHWSTVASAGLSVEALCEELGIARTTLTRLLREYCGLFSRRIHRRPAPARAQRRTAHAAQGRGESPLGASRLSG